MADRTYLAAPRIPQGAVSGLVARSDATGRIVWGRVDEVGLGQMPRAEARNNANQSIPDNTPTAVIFSGGDNFDTRTMHDTAVNPERIVIPTAGLYVVTANVRFAAGAGSVGYRTALLRLNGVTVLCELTVAAITARTFQHVNLTDQHALVAADYLEVVVQHTQGAAIDVQSGAGQTVFSAAMVQGT